MVEHFKIDSLIAQNDLINNSLMTFVGVSKYGSDSERDSIIGTSHDGGPSHSRGPSQLFVPPRMHYPYHPHPHPHINHSRESFNFEPYQHNHSPSVDAGTRRRPDLLETGGTYPRNPRNR